MISIHQSICKVIRSPLTRGIYFALIAFLVLGLSATGCKHSSASNVAAINSENSASEIKKEEFLYPCKINGKWGYVDVNDNTVIEGKFDDVDWFCENRAIVTNVVKGTRQVGIIDRKGNLIVPFGLYKYIENYSCGLAAVILDSDTVKLGFVDPSGKLVISSNYYGPWGSYEFTRYGFEGDYCCVSEGQRMPNKAIINRKGDLVYTSMELDGLCGDFLIYKKNGKKGLMDFKGNKLTNPDYDKIGPNSEGMISVKASGKWGYIDYTGKLVIKPAYDEAGEFVSGLARVRTGCNPSFMDGIYGYIDKTGKLVIDDQYQMASDFSEGLAAVKLNDKWGFIDINGQFKISPSFFKVGRFYDGQTVVVIRVSDSVLKAGYIRPDGSFIINPEEKYCSPTMAASALGV